MREMKLLLLGLILASGCGYRLVGKDNNLASGITRIYVAPSKNNSLESGLELLLRQELLKQLGSKTNITITEKREAQAELESEIVGVSISYKAYDKTGKVALEEFSIKARFKIVALPDRKNLFDSGLIELKKDYPVGNDFIQNEKNKSLAKKEILSEIVELALEIMFRGF